MADLSVRIKEEFDGYIRESINFNAEGEDWFKN